LALTLWLNACATPTATVVATPAVSPVSVSAIETESPGATDTPAPTATFLPIVARDTLPPNTLAFSEPVAARASVPLYQKFEITFDVAGTVATNLDFPYDPAAPPGLPGRIGVSVEALFLPPGESDWGRALLQPAFRYQPYERIVRADTAEGLYPDGAPVWLVRFAPTVEGEWRYRLRVQDASICAAGLNPCALWLESPAYTFTATAAEPGDHGFIRVSASDPRYFEFSDGTPFLGAGFQTSFGYGTQVESTFAEYQANGVNFLRTWMSATGVFSVGFWNWDAWANSWLVWDEHLPGKDVSARIVGEGDAPCIFLGFGENARPAFKGNTTYHLLIRAKLKGVTQPRVAGKPYGLVAKIGFWPKELCFEQNDLLTTLSPYWNGDAEWAEYTATFSLPADTLLDGINYFTLALENTNGGTAYIDEVRVSEQPGGPNILPHGDMNYHLYFDQASAWRWDYLLDRAAEREVYFKLVLHEVQDGILRFINPDGTSAAEPDDDNFYGVPGQPTKVRRLQEYFWRYLSARWGYSTAVHSWELLNEGDPFNGNHYDLANALGGIIRATDPNRHLVTTSFWHSFPVEPFWANAQYPNLDYADFHAYVDTSWLKAPEDIRDPLVKAQCGDDQTCYLNAMVADTALFHTEHSVNAFARSPGRPVVRGESAITLPDSGQQTDPQLVQDVNGVWLHKFLFARLHPGGLYELYWYNDEILRNQLYGVFSRFHDFIAGVRLNSGAWVDAQPSADTGLRALGQRETGTDRAVLWIDNRAHTWKRMVNGQPIAPVSGRVRVSGFPPGASLAVEWWDTCSGEPPACRVSVTKRETLTADASGTLTLNLANLATDVAVKVGEFGP
jgi:hypothetical protein